VFQKETRNNGKPTASKLVKVKNQYKDVQDYENTYEPLILEEAKSQIIRGKDEDDGIFFSFYILLISNSSLFKFGNNHWRKWHKSM